MPNTEGLQEVRVISNNFSAEYGRGQAVISMSTKSGTNAFHGQGVYMMRHEGLDANTLREQRAEHPQARVPRQRRRRLDRRSDPPQQAVLLQQLSRPAQQPDLDRADDGPDGARARRQLQPDVHPRRERQSGAGAHLRPVQRRAGRAGPLPPRRDSRTRSSPTRIRTRCGCSATTRSRTGRRTTSTTRTTSRRRRRRRCGATARTTASTSSMRQPLDLRQRRHLVRRDHHAAAVRHGAVQRRRRHPRRQESLHPDGRRDRRQPDARRRRPLRAEPDQYQEPLRQQGGVRRLRTLRRPGQRAAADAASGHRAERQSRTATAAATAAAATGRR